MTIQNSPKISVILPVYNSERFVGQAIQSVLDQTFGNFELIIINDGSTDGSLQVLKSFDDPRIRLFHQQNIGLAASLNKGLEVAAGEFIARMDNDDICSLERFERQVNYLEKNPGICMVGTGASIIDAHGTDTGRRHQHATDPLVLKFQVIFDNPFVHSSVMLRKSCLEKTGNYNTSNLYFEDHNLWSRMARVSNVANIGERLMKYRELSSGMSKNTTDYFKKIRNQCVENVYYYSSRLSITEIEHFADYRVGLKDYPQYNEALAFMQRTFNVISADFASREKVSGKILQPVTNYHLNQFKRRHYNKVLNSDKSTTYEKLQARVLRRIVTFGENKIR